MKVTRISERGKELFLIARFIFKKKIFRFQPFLDFSILSLPYYRRFLLSTNLFICFFVSQGILKAIKKRLEAHMKSKGNVGDARAVHEHSISAFLMFPSQSFISSLVEERRRKEELIQNFSSFAESSLLYSSFLVSFLLLKRYQRQHCFWWNLHIIKVFECTHLQARLSIVVFLFGIFDV